MVVVDGGGWWWRSLAVMVVVVVVVNGGDGVWHQYQPPSRGGGCSGHPSLHVSLFSNYCSTTVANRASLTLVAGLQGFFRYY